jgi:NADPH-dependent ferric siderophore reductase
MTTGTRRTVPDHLFGGRLKDCFLLDLTVTAIADDRPTVRTLTFTSPDLIGFASLPGQDVMFEIPTVTQPVRRRYTIRRTNPERGTLDIDVVLHGSGPFANWAATVAIGDRIEGIGPRGVVTLADTEHHLFVADDSAVPFTLAMIEALPSGVTATAIVVTDDPDSLPPAPASAAAIKIIWTSPSGLQATVESLPIAPGTAAYVNGERTMVSSTVDQLGRRGIGKDTITSKAYWRRDQANALHGEPANG